MNDSDPNLEELDRVCNALAHASRRQILQTVWLRRGITSNDIAQNFACAWATISRHLRVLETAGLLSQEKNGRFRYYRVNNDRLDVVRHWLAWFAAENATPPYSETREQRWFHGKIHE